MNKYEIRTQKKKTAIINASLELFSNRGFIAVSIKDIAALANVSQVSIYNYFGNKEALVTECVSIVMKDTLQMAQDLLSIEMNFKEKLLKALSLCSNQINHSLYEYFSQSALEDPSLQNLLLENINTIKKAIYRDYIELGKKENVIDHSISTSTILELIEAINTIGINIQSADIETKQKELHKLFLYGIIGKDK
ncbi:TetR/AcrR family transcriptional regulator [Bacillus mobilis]|uniref:TetR family transcriptional regulator n=2 Tax=Bacillus cereus group TaxID=86661 RepID=A0A1C4CKS8_BACCE|nr:MULTISPECIES: TetR/AcrR family transcriptional regulator [Bacillus cereus group]MCU5595858.1 TetR/AcrR family transcriptional regulator [Bacillus mobilis]MCU5739627.1 TetR/AcrR family transcriptional regulator [Bacillus mobilis]MCU9562131.1 TetR/AcrR family transcriptional regulator [Bacillus mobilis]OKA37560.1 TetR family transcriptional regulator [Bacillus cereus]OKA40412.1 TetR family transcriptional regulator [Bacillus cereus]